MSRTLVDCVLMLLLLCYENDIPCRVTQNRLLKGSLERHINDRKVILKVLKGTHVNGSFNRNESGAFDYVYEILALLNT